MNRGGDSPDHTLTGAISTLASVATRSARNQDGPLSSVWTSETRDRVVGTFEML
jgi:hypothetical protein